MTIGINAYNAQRYYDRLSGQLYEWNADTQVWDAVGDPGVIIKTWPLADVLAEGADAGGHVIENVGDPLAPQDAATKAYVDAIRTELIGYFGAVSGLADSSFLFETAGVGEGDGIGGVGGEAFQWLTDAAGTA